MVKTHTGANESNLACWCTGQEIDVDTQGECTINLYVRVVKYLVNSLVRQ
jgi:hypothetical protein